MSLDNYYIYFTEGLSGRFLEYLLRNQINTSITPQFRFDLQPGLGITGNPDHGPIPPNAGHHPNNSFDKTIRVLALTRMYNGIYNAFHKKFVLDSAKKSINNWHNDPLYWYDNAYMSIKRYHHMLLTEIRTNTIPDIVDFGRFNDISYLNKINLKYNNTNLSDTQIKFANKYISLQLDITLNNTIIKDMRNIISVIPDNYFYTDPWFFPYCVFHYEYSNGLTNYHRLWDITDVTIGDKQKLLEISLQYDANYQEF